MRILISWSGTLSHKVALALHKWIPTILPYIEPWVSSEDIRKGARWALELGQTLDEISYSILCFTPDNLEAPWIIFEAGAVSKHLDLAHVAPLLFGVSYSELAEPIQQFQGTKYDKLEVLRLIRSINEAAGPDGLTSEVLDHGFEQRWPSLDSQLTRLQPKVRAQQPKPDADPYSTSMSDLTSLFSEDLDALKKVIYRERLQAKFSRPRPVPPLSYQITQVLPDGNQRRFPDVGFTIGNLSDSSPVRATVSVELRLRELDGAIIRKSKDALPIGYYSGDQSWNLNPHSAVNGHFEVPPPFRPGADQQLEIRVTVTAIDAAGVATELLPLGYVYVAERNSWYCEP